MSSYQQLAGAYDELTWDVGYEKRADFLEKLFRRSRIPVHTVLDLACGTGSMTWLLAGRGYELIAVDGSEEMLAAAREKSAPAEVPPLFLHQSMPRLDLYGTVDAAICCLDSLNYLTNPRDVQRTFQRLHLFISPGGLLAFDVRLPERLAALEQMGRRQMNVAEAERYVEGLLAQRQRTPPRSAPKYIIKDVRLFLNSVTRGMETIRRAGVDAQYRKQESDEAITITIQIPKKRTEQAG